MADQPYTEADVERLAEAMYEDDEGSTPGGWYKPWVEADKSASKAYRRRAKVALDALATAGRLLPEGAAQADCGCSITVEAATITRHTRECGNREAAARLAAHIADEYGSTDE